MAHPTRSARRTHHHAAIAAAATLACLPFAVPAASDDPANAPAPTAGDREDAGTVSFRVTDQQGRAIPCRLSFLEPDGTRPELFPNADADPDTLAVRRNTVYTMTGSGRITVPPGTYTVWASHGLEWGVGAAEIDVRPGGAASFSIALEHQVDTTGWVSGDFHLHTLTHSGHGDANLNERIISIVGEGVEFAVATDHNHNTDYSPAMKRVGATRHLTSVTGNEVSTPIGHLNAFPLEPDRPIPPHRFPAAEPIFKFIREEPNRYGVVPIIQLNHPRWSGINYFGQTGLDPVTGVSTDEAYSDDFDTIEVFNENENWGYFDPDLTDLPVSSGSFSVLRDWFNLLNRGHTAAAVGNSDSHTVESEIAGIPRNFIRSSTDDPGRIDPAEIVANQRAKAVFTTSGPFVEYAVQGQPMGSTVTLAEKAPGASAREVEVSIRVQAADWVDCDVIKVIVNGDLVRQIPVPQTRSVERLRTTVRVPIESDSWLTLLAEGDESLAPIVHDQGRPILPIAVMNPVWIDADGDGTWRSPYAQAAAMVEHHRPGRPFAAALRGAPAWRRALTAQAIASYRPSDAAETIASLLDDEDRYVRLSAAKAAERLAAPSLVRPIARAAAAAGGDGQLRMALFAADVACGAGVRTEAERRESLMAMIESGGAPLLARFSGQLLPLLGGEPIRDFLFVGMFESPTIADVETLAYPPETEPDSGPFQTRTGPKDWSPIRADARGYVNLLFAETEESARTQSIAYLRTWILSPDSRETMLAFGTDDGACLWVNGERLVVDTEDHSADPLRHLVRVRLRPGRNELLLKVANGGGDFGAYLRLLDDLETTNRRD